MIFKEQQGSPVCERGEGQKHKSRRQRLCPSVCPWPAWPCVHSAAATASPLVGNGGFITSNFPSIQIPTSLPMLLSEKSSTSSFLSPRFPLIRAMGKSQHRFDIFKISNMWHSGLITGPYTELRLHPSIHLKSGSKHGCQSLQPQTP